MRLLIALMISLPVAAVADYVVIGDQEFTTKGPYCGS
jgi:hypothetical protein